jgi:3-hydroxybutyryl-CoA dehydrogenase
MVRHTPCDLRGERWYRESDIAHVASLRLFFTPHFTKFSENMSTSTSLPMVKHLGIVGAGTMGTGIAQLAALAGIDVALYDINDTVLRQALERLKRSFNQAVQKGELGAEKSTEAFTRIHPRTRITDLSHSEVVVEAAIEDLRIKKDLFKHLEAGTKPTAILASNTSSLSITAIASATHRQEKIVGLHFMHPIESVKVVEIVQTTETSQETLQRCHDFLIQLGKTPVTVADSPGFIINRIGHPFHGEALQILGEHIADAVQIDRIMKAEGGFTRGPFESLDITGLDTALDNTKALFDAYSGDSRFRPHPIQKRMVESGMLGQKSGRGFYTYEQEKK